MTSYNLKDKVHNGYILARATKGMYEIPQAGRITHDYLFQYLSPYGYHPTKTTQDYRHMTAAPSISP